MNTTTEQETYVLRSSNFIHAPGLYFPFARDARYNATKGDAAEYVYQFNLLTAAWPAVPKAVLCAAVMEDESVRVESDDDEGTVSITVLDESGVARISWMHPPGGHNVIDELRAGSRARKVIEYVLAAVSDPGYFDGADEVCQQIKDLCEEFAEEE